MKPVGLSPEAVLELAEAASWYETRQPGLAIRFLQEIDQTRHSIQSRPLSFPRLADTASDLEIRRALLPRFPYALVFLELPTEIRVLAVAHAKRRPGLLAQPPANQLKQIWDCSINASLSQLSCKRAVEEGGEEIVEAAVSVKFSGLDH